MGRKTPPVNEKAVEAKEKKALDKFVKEQRAKKQEEVRRTIDTWQRCSTRTVSWRDPSMEIGKLTSWRRLCCSSVGCDVEGSRGREEDQSTSQERTTRSRGEYYEPTEGNKTTRADGHHGHVLTALNSPAERRGKKPS